MIQYVHHDGWNFPHHFILFPHNAIRPGPGYSKEIFDWITSRAGAGFNDMAATISQENAGWWYDGRTIAIRNHDVAMEFRLRWC